MVCQFWQPLIALVSETNADSTQIKTQTRNLSRCSISSQFSAPIQPKYHSGKLLGKEKNLPTSGGTAILSTLPLRGWEMNQNERGNADKSRVVMSTVKSHSLEILCISIYGYPQTYNKESELMNRQRTNNLSYKRDCYIIMARTFDHGWGLQPWTTFPSHLEILGRTRVEGKQDLCLLWPQFPATHVLQKRFTRIHISLI